MSEIDTGLTKPGLTPKLKKKLDKPEVKPGKISWLWLNVRFFQIFNYGRQQLSLLDEALEVNNILNKNVTKESKKFDKDLCEDPIEEKVFKLMVVTSTKI